VKMQGVDQNGYYTLLVNTDDVTDQEGFNGLNGKQVGWMLFKGGLVQYNVAPWPSAEAGNVTTSNDGETSGETDYGSNITMTATPQEGYVFDYWGTIDESVESATTARALKRGGEEGTTLLESQISRFSNENPVSVPMNKSRNMRAVFKAQTFRVNIVADEKQGTVKTPSAVYEYGEVLSLHAEPAEGYSFIGWSDGEQTLSTEADYNYTVTKTATLTALFKSNAPESILLREAVDYTPIAVASANVRLQRTFEKNLWNTICVPVDIPTPSDVFGADTKVARLNGIERNTVLFTTVENIEANVPYLIMVGKVNSNSSVADSTSLQSIYSISNTEMKLPGETDMIMCVSNIQMIGSYVDNSIPVADDYFILSSDILNIVAEGDSVTTGRYRAYFHVPGASANNLKIAFDGIVTDVHLVKAAYPATTPASTYTLSGLKVEEGKKLPKGIYIHDGKKVVIK